MNEKLRNMPCHDRGTAALAMAFDQGTKANLSPKDLEGCRGRLERPSDGSGNWPIHMEAALHLAGFHDGSNLLPWLIGANGWGHNGKECGSFIYEDSNTAAALALLNRSPKTTVRDAARKYIQGQWVKQIRCFGPSPEKVRILVNGQWIERAADRRRYQWLPWFTYLPGHRAISRPNLKRPKSVGLHFDVRFGQRAVFYAIHGVEKIPRTGIPRLASSCTLGSVLPYIFSRCNDYGIESPNRFIRLLRNPNKNTIADLPSCEPFRIPVRVIRYRDGSIACVLPKSDNGNKPSSNAVVYDANSKTAIIAIPSQWRGVGAKLGEGFFSGDGSTVTAIGDSGNFQVYQNTSGILMDYWADGWLRLQGA